MSGWVVFSGSGHAPAAPGGPPAWAALPAPPPWRRAPGQSFSASEFITTPELLDAVNASLHLRRPLLLTGLPGSGKSTLVDLIAAELDLGPVLNWHITSKTVLTDGLYDYDALGRLQDVEASRGNAGRPVQDFVSLGPLGTALASVERPRALLIDEIDKSDLDLPSDLLNVLEEGSFTITQLLREMDDEDVGVRGVDGEVYPIRSGRVEAQHLPVIVMTSNGERAFPPPFLRRCVRYTIPPPDEAMLSRIVSGYLSSQVADRERAVIEDFAGRIRGGESLAVDQLLNALHLVTGHSALTTDERQRVEQLLLRSLNGT